MFDAISQFRDAIRTGGLEPPDVIEAGKMYRFPGIGKRQSNRAGWCKLFDDGLGGCFGDWSSSLSEYWQAKRDKPFTHTERAAFKRHVAKAQEQAEAERKARQAKAASKATRLWERATPAQAHPYLKHKGLSQTHGIRIDAGGRLLVPVYGPDGRIQSLQTITGNGSKRFMTGGRMASGFYWLRPLESVVETAAPIVLVEGFATAASIAEAAPWPVVCCFTAGNLDAVARMIANQYTDRRIVIAGDNDTKTDGNPGRTQATIAAEAVDGLAIFPPESGDWNDYFQAHGLEAMRDTMKTEIQFHGPYETDREHREQREQSDSDGISSVPGGESGPGTTRNSTDSGIAEDDGESDIPDASIEPPCFAVHLEWCQFDGRKLKPGLWWHGVKENKEGLEYTHTWISSPLMVEAITAGENGGDFGRLLRFWNSHHQLREWAMPMRLLKGSGDEMRGELLDQGVTIDPKARNLLANFIMGQHPKRRILAASRIGWHGKAFVLPGRVVGKADVVFQSELAGLNDFTQAGTASGWVQDIGRMCVGNIPLMVSVSAALAGPLLQRVNHPGGGIHWMGDSSTGKSTTIEVAATVWGPPEFIRSWSTTANGFEGVAAARNDTCLILDEISEASPYEVGRIAYMLANGQGKQRAGRTGLARTIQRWRLMTLSTGERSLSAVMAEIGRKPSAGQLVRLLTIPANFEHGAFSDLHGFSDGRSLADHLKQVRTRHYGHLGPAFLERLVEDDRDIPGLLASLVDAMSREAKTSLESRAAAFFAVVGMAGELAVEYGLLPWPEGSSIEAALESFTRWRTAQGQPVSEDAQILANVEEFIGRHGDSRFSPLHGDIPEANQANVRDRAGWFKGNEGDRAFLFMRAALLEAGGGFDQKRITQALDRAGWLAEKDTGRLTHKVRTPMGPMNLYHIQPAEDSL